MCVGGGGRDLSGSGNLSGRVLLNRCQKGCGCFSQLDAQKGGIFFQPKLR